MLREAFLSFEIPRRLRTDGLIGNTICVVFVECHRMRLYLGMGVV